MKTNHDRPSMPDKPQLQGRQTTLRESDGRIVPHPAEYQSVREKPGNAGVGKAARISRESDRTPSVLRDGFAVLNRLARITFDRSRTNMRWLRSLARMHPNIWDGHARLLLLGVRW